MLALPVAAALLTTRGAPRDVRPVSDLRLGATRVVMGRGRTETVALNGSLAKWAKAESDDRSVVRVEKEGGALTLTAVKAGDAVVTVAAGKVVKALSVSVRRWAVEFPQTLSAQVVGSPASLDSVRGACEAALRLNLRRAPGTTFTYAVENPVPVGPGVRAQIPVRVKARGPASLASEGRVLVDVENVASPSEPAEALWYSNDPESVKSPQGLFASELDPGKRVRFLHHHMNASRTPMFFRVFAINDGDTPVRLALAGAESGPDKDPVRAGLIAGAAFMRSWPTLSGEVVEVPARSFVPLSFRRVTRGQTVSGLFSIVSLSGDSPVTVVSDAVPPFPVASDWKSALLSGTPWRTTGARPLQQLYRTPSSASVHVYPDPIREEDVPYRVGGRFGYLRIGQRAVVRQDKEGQLDGNFGVAYRYNLSLQNPTGTTTAVEIAFEASAGYSAGVFLVDGQLVKTPLLRPKGEARIAKVFLNPGETRAMKLVTMPLSGSSYPATVIIRPVGIK